MAVKNKKANPSLRDDMPETAPTHGGTREDYAVPVAEEAPAAEPEWGSRTWTEAETEAFDAPVAEEVEEVEDLARPLDLNTTLKRSRNYPAI